MTIMQRAGLEPVLAENGEEAVKLATSGSFDLIFMDMQMPVMNGYQATEILRYKGITSPIVALTANAMKNDEEKCLASGCDHYLAKPIDLNKLHEVLDKYLLATPAGIAITTEYQYEQAPQDVSDNLD